jgi:hypothetical protein
MFSMLVVAIMAGMAGLILYELIDEVRGSSHDLHDHYHE